MMLEPKLSQQLRNWVAGMGSKSPSALQDRKSQVDEDVIRVSKEESRIT